jgi:hypothetical protein
LTLSWLCLGSHSTSQSLQHTCSKGESRTSIIRRTWQSSTTLVTPNANPLIVFLTEIAEFCNLVEWFKRDEG